LIKDHNSAAMDDDQESEENQEKLKTAIKVLSPDCKKILELFYFKEYDMESIARDMYYKNADTAKSKKSLCMKCLIKEMNKLSKLMVF
jgi:DNA-directed RNA polymerase specialized sigma24 family protein